MLKKLFYIVFAAMAANACLPALSLGQTVSATEEERIRKAEKLFSNKEYDRAMPLFAQVVSNHSDQAEYNYKLGVCMVLAGSDKAGAVRFLQQSVTSTQTPINAWMYLGMSQHHAGNDSGAVRSFETFRDGAGKQSWKDMNGEQWLQMSRNAIASADNVPAGREHRIVDTYSCGQTEFFSRYGNLPEVGRFLVMPKEYAKWMIKGRPECALVFLNPEGKVMVFSGKSPTGNDMDVYMVRKGPDNKWMLPETIAGVNTKNDEAYPVVSPDGQTLYFSSKGTGSTGGYDIFMSQLQLSTRTWSAPVSMGAQVNSPGDDYCYVPSADGKEAYFSSDRSSVPGKCQVFRAQVHTGSDGTIGVEGTFACASALKESEARVTILRSADHSLVQELRQAGSRSAYNIRLAAATSYTYRVELPGFTFHDQEVDLTAFAEGTLLQEITLRRGTGGMDSLTITQRLKKKATAFAAAEEPAPAEPAETAQVNAQPATTPQANAQPAPATETGAASTKAEPLVSIVQTTQPPPEPAHEPAPALIASTSGATITVPDVRSESGKSTAAVSNPPSSPSRTESTQKNTQPAVVTQPINTEATSAQQEQPAKTKQNRPEKHHTVAHPKTGTAAAKTPASGSQPVQHEPNTESPAPAQQYAETASAASFGDVVFHIQVGAYRDKTPEQLKKKFAAVGLKDLVYLRNDQGILLAMTGTTPDYNRAAKLKETIIRQGIPDAFIVAYSKGKRLPVNMVVMLEDKQDE